MLQLDPRDAVAFRYGHTLASTSTDRIVRLWTMNVDQAIQRIRATTSNILTRTKWERYVSKDLPYSPPCQSDQGASPAMPRR
jgi:hypothetical protein